MLTVLGFSKTVYLNNNYVSNSVGVVRTVTSFKANVMWVREYGNSSAPFEVELPFN